MIEIQNGTLPGKISSSDEVLKGTLTTEKKLKGTLGTAPGSPTQFHSSLIGRNEENSHPIEAITNLPQVLDTKMSASSAMTNRDIENLLKLFV